MPHFTSLKVALEKKRQELARLEIELQQAQDTRLQNLYVEHGFASVDELIIALTKFASPPLRELIVKTAQTSTVGGTRRRPRATITDAMRQEIGETLRSSGHTANKIAQKFKVSPSYVNQLKHRMGLTQKRSG